MAKLFDVNMVAVKEQAAKNPQNNPLGFNSTSWLIKFVAKTVPNNTKTIAINFLAEGNCLPKILSTKILIQTVCINNTIAIDTLIYCTAR